MANITFKQVKAIMSILGCPEAEVRTHFATSQGVTSDLIGAAKRGDYDGVRAAMSAAGIDYVTNDNIPDALYDRVQAYAAKAAGKPASDSPSSTYDYDAAHPEEPAPPAQAAEAPTPGPESSDFATAAAGTVAAVVQRLGILSPAFVDGVRADLENVVALGVSAINAAREAAEASKPGLPALPPAAAGYFRPSWFAPLACACRAGLDVILSGPAGVGKSRAARELAADMGRPCHVFACRAGMTRADLFYSRSITDGQTAYELAPMLRAVQEPGVICLDEVFSLDPEVLLGLNGLLESSQRSIDTPLGTITRHPDCVFILTANIAGRSESRIYRGAQAQDASVLSRCLNIRTAYEPEVEKQIARAQVPDKGEAYWLVGIVSELRAALGRAQIAHDVTPRAYSQIGALMRQGMDKEAAARLVLAGPLEASEWAKVAASVGL